MPTKKKYKAKCVFWNTINRRVINASDVEQYRVKGRLRLPDNLIRFDSIHEFRVYLELVRMYGINRVKTQHSVEIIPIGYCYPNGKKWKVDFAIIGDDPLDLPQLLVEAKGAVLLEFQYILATLENFDCDLFDCLRLVFPRRLPLNNRVIKALHNSEFRKNLLTLQELERLKYLP